MPPPRSASPGTTTQGASFVATSVDHPRLLRTDAESVRVFLRLYDQYSKEVSARAQQITAAGAISLEAARPVNLKFCVDPEYLESAIALDLIEGVSSYSELSDAELRSYLDKKSEESLETVTLDTLDAIVSRELRMDMADKNARSRMEGLFVSYHALLRRNGISWLLKKNQKVAVEHVLSAVRPWPLKERLEADLAFANHNLKDDFKQFMKHAVRLSEAFQLVDTGPKQAKAREARRDGKHPQSNHGNSNSPSRPKEKRINKDGSPSRTLPDCPYGPCKEKGLKHLVKDCPDSTQEEKDKLMAELRAQKAATGPTRSTRSQTKSSASSVSSSRGADQPTKSRVTGRLAAADNPLQNVDSQSAATPSFRITVSDGQTSLEGTGRCDDGSDDSIISAALAERAVVRGIGKINVIEQVCLSVALKAGTEPQKFSFSRQWTAPRTVLHLSSGQLALVNVCFLVADGDLACEDLLLGLPVLQHLQVDTRTLLESKRELLDGSDCSQIGNPTTLSRGGAVSRMMIARLNRVYDSGNTIDAALHTAPAPDRPRVDYYSSRTEEDPFPDQSLLDRLDEPQAAAVQTAIDAALRQAKENGLPPDSAAALDDLIRVHTNVFRVGFSAGPPANIRPLKITLTPDARPVKVRLRNYSCEQREFLAAFVDELVRNGMAFANPTSAWASAPLLVPKAGPSRFRFTVDLRPVNKFTVKHHYPMPHLEHELPKLSASQFFAIFDLSHGYWQLELDESSQQLQSFITPDGIYTPTRVLHGTTNAVTHLQSSLAEAVPPTLRQFLLHWLDDVLLHHSTVEGLLDAVRQFLLLCVKLNLKLHPAKSVFFATSVRWCGRLISAEGIRYDPRRLEGLLQMEPPTSGAHLQQFICALQWVRHGIPQFARLVQPLQEFMERVCEHAGKRTARAVARVQLSALGWGNSERAAFEACKSALAHQVTLSHRDERQRLCFFTDASDMVWSGIVTQVPREDLVKPHVAQRHQPLAFLSGRFNATQLGWSVLEKEAFAVLASLERMHWLAATPDGFDLFTDHNNLVFIFDPLSIVPDMSQTTLRKVLRWAVRLSTYNYTCLHIKGTDNVWADLLGRWSAPATIRRLIRIPELPSSSDPDFEWPSLDSLADAQQTYAAIRPPGLSQSHAVLRNPEGAIWIPDPASDLQLRLCVIAHTGPSGHRGQAVTESALRQHYYWSTMSADVRSFVRACIHCLSTVGGGKIPRPYGPSVHGTSPNDLLQFDYIEIGPGHKGEKYVLMLRDDHSSYAWFFPFADTSAENAAIALIDWCAAFGVPQGLMSDGPTHFRNETLRLLAKGLKTPHHFTLPYSPWSNGAIERLGKEMLRVFRSVISELRMGFNEWPDILPLVQSVLNNSPSPQRQNIAPLTAFTGNLPTPPISTFVRSSTATPVTLSDAQKERLQNINALKDRITELRPLVQESLRVQREKGRAAASRGALANFLEGDFVLVARDDFSAGEKLALRWRGPRRIVKAINDYVYQVEDLRNGVLEEVHATRLKFYRDASLDSVAILPHVLSSETGMPVARLMRLYEDEDGLKVVVRWKGLSHSEDTSEPLRHVYEDVPDMLIRLLQRKNTPQDLAAKARTVLAL